MGHLAPMYGMTCRMKAAGSVDTGDGRAFPLLLVRTLSAPTTVYLECRSEEGPQEVDQVRLTAIRVAPVVQPLH